MFDEVLIPTLETQRLVLRPWREPDVAPMTEINREPEVRRWLGVDPDKTAERVQAWLAHWQRHGFGLWAVEEKASGGFIGRIGVAHQDDWTVSAHDAEIGWTLGGSAWGRGYATEGATAVLEFARAHGLREIISITRPANVRSRRVMEKLGLTYRGATHWHGYDQVWYGTELDPSPSLAIEQI